MRAAEDGGGDRGRGRPVPRGEVDLAARQRSSQKRLAGGPDHYRTTELGELVKTRKHLEAVRGFLREAKTGVHQHVLLGNARTGGKGHALAHLVQDLVDHLGVDRLLIHVTRATPRVHQHDGHAVPGNDCGQIGLVSQTADVVDERRAGRERGIGCRGFVGVHRDRHLNARGQCLDYGEHAAAFLGLGRRLRAGPGGLAADVEQVGAVLDHPYTCIDRGGGVEELAAVGERVRSDVDDAHHQRTLPQHQ